MNQNIILAQNQGVYSDYESVMPTASWCTPSLLGFSVCVDASASGGVVTLKLTLRTPAGSYSKTFQFNSNVCFDWNLPIPLSPGVGICISDLTTSPRVSFTLTLKLCISVPIVGRKCISWSHRFELPFASNQMYGAANTHISPDDLAALAQLFAHALDEKSSNECNCH